MWNICDDSWNCFFDLATADPPVKVQYELV